MYLDSVLHLKDGCSDPSLDEKWLHLLLSNKHKKLKWEKVYQFKETKNILEAKVDNKLNNMNITKEPKQEKQ